MAIEVRVVQGEVLTQAVDLLVLKFAQAHSGVAGEAADRLHVQGLILVGFGRPPVVS